MAEPSLLIERLEAAGCHASVADGRLKLSGQRPPNDLLSETRNAGPNLVRFLRQRRCISSKWDADGWRTFFDERAGIAEFDHHLSRAEAEALAYESCIVVWLNRNPPSENGPECCIQCNKPMEETEALPFLTGDGGHIWMHDHCHAAWMRRRQAEAAGALRRMGVAPPSI